MTLKSLFSFRGCFSKAEFWLWGVGIQSLAVILWITVLVVFEEPVRDAALAIVSFIVIVLVIAGYASTAKRLHDMGHSGWWSLLVYGGLLMLWVGTTKSVVTPKVDVKDSSKNLVNPTSAPNGWILVGISGQYTGCKFPLDVDIFIGTDPSRCNIIIEDNQNPGIRYVSCALMVKKNRNEMPSLSFVDDEEDSSNQAFYRIRSEFIKSGTLKLRHDLIFEVRAAN